MASFKVITAVHLFLINGQNELLLARRFNTGYEDGKYSVVAGHVEEGETLQQAMTREAKEEAGITIAEHDLTFAHVMYRQRENAGHSDRIDFFFASKSWQGVPQIMETDKCDDLAWFSPHALPDHTIPYVKSAIEAYIAKKSFSEYGW